MRDSIVALARGQVGTRYLIGGQTPEGGFDCSGLVRYVMAALQVRLPRTAKQQASAGSSVTRDMKHLKPGDLLTFGRTKTSISHVGIYVGDGRYVHASSVAGRVIESDVDRPGATLVRAWRGVRRLVTAAADSTKKKPRLSS
jgi:cell wall-associated NlpC family hydrolase